MVTFAPFEALFGKRKTDDQSPNATIPHADDAGEGPPGRRWGDEAAPTLDDQAALAAGDGGGPGIAAAAPPDTGRPDNPAGHENLLIVGDGGRDVVLGQGGNDELYGARGDDRVMGKAGRDFLSGNQGDDVLIGGADADTFCFDGDFDTEIVHDFDAAEGDRLKFILYIPEQEELTEAELLALFQQTGRDAELRFEGTDERVLLRQVDVDALTEEMISVQIIGPPDPLIA